MWPGTDRKDGSRKDYNINWTERFVYPYGISFDIEIPEDRGFDYNHMKLSIEFSNQNIGFTMKITDKKRWSFLPALKSFWGHVVEHKNGT